MADRHELAANALECAVFGLPEPRTDWKREIPTRDWKTARAGGSPNINGMAAAADLYYASSRRARDVAAERMRECARFNRQQWMLAEPETGIYRQWHLNYWAATVQIARGLGMDDLANQFMWLLEEDAERSALMAATLESSRIHPNNQADRELYRKIGNALSAHVGDEIICRMGARSWGSGGSGSYGVDMPWQQVARSVLFDAPFPPTKGNPGDLGGFHHTMRVAKRLMPIFRSAATEAKSLSVEALVDRSLHWSPSHTGFQYLGWEDGSRLCVMGIDEPAFRDDDPNSNTPGVLAYGVVGGRMCYLPEWPNPWNGDVKIRQTNMRADIDILWNEDDPVRLELFHSHIGRERAAVDGQSGTFYRSVFELPDSPLLFHLMQRPGVEWEDMVYSAPSPPTAPPTVPPTTPPSPPAPKPPKRSLWQRIMDWFERLVD